MTPSEIAAIALGLGAGGIVGALAALTLGGERLAEAFAEFRQKFEAYTSSKSDPETQAIKASFEEVVEALKTMSEAQKRLKRAFKRR